MRWVACFAMSSKGWHLACGVYEVDKLSQYFLHSSTCHFLHVMIFAHAYTHLRFTAHSTFFFGILFVYYMWALSYFFTLSSFFKLFSLVAFSYRKKCMIYYSDFLASSILYCIISCYVSMFSSHWIMCSFFPLFY